jgi:hypothetical protein
MIQQLLAIASAKVLWLLAPELVELALATKRVRRHLVKLALI